MRAGRAPSRRRARRLRRAPDRPVAARGLRRAPARGQRVLALCDEFDAAPLRTPATRGWPGRRHEAPASDGHGQPARGGSAIVALGAWLVYATEWVDVEVPTLPRGEAARDPLLRDQAARAPPRRQGRLAAEPRPRCRRRARRWCSARRLEPRSPSARSGCVRWVEAGGRLVVDAAGDRREHRLAAVPRCRNRARLQRAARRRTTGDVGPDDRPTCGRAAADTPARPPRSRSSARATIRSSSARCSPRPRPRARTRPRTALRVCSASGGPASSRQAGVAARGSRRQGGARALRAALGQGRVTVSALRPAAQPRSASTATRLGARGALELRPGDEIWFVAEEERAAAAAAGSGMRPGRRSLLGSLALALALWRGALRFGPLAARAAAGTALGRRADPRHRRPSCCAAAARRCIARRCARSRRPRARASPAATA